MENIDFNDMPETQVRVEKVDETDPIDDDNESDKTVNSLSNEEVLKDDEQKMEAGVAGDSGVTVSSSKAGTSKSEPMLNSSHEDSPQFLKTRKLTTIRLPWNDMRSSFESILEKLEEVRQQGGTLGLRMARLENRVGTSQDDMKAGLGVNEVSYSQLNGRIDGIVETLVRLESDVSGNNSARHESRLDVLGINMDTVTAVLRTIEGEVRSMRQFMATTRDSLERLTVLEAQLNNIMTKLNSTSAHAVVPAPAMVPAINLKKIEVPAKTPPAKGNNSPVAGPSEASMSRASMKRVAGPLAASTPKQSAKKIKKEPEPLDDDDDQGPWVFGCRMGQINSRTGKFIKACTFKTTHFSLMKKHQNNVMHGEYLSDGVTMEKTYKKAGDKWICARTNMNGKECKHPSSAIGTHNRHARQRCHMEDLLILSTACAICKKDFRCNEGLIYHTGATKECANRRGFFGRDSQEEGVDGETCASCGTSGFRDAKAVIEHQMDGSCNPQGSDASDDKD